MSDDAAHGRVLRYLDAHGVRWSRELPDGWGEHYEVSDDGRIRSLPRVVHRRSSRAYVRPARELAPRLAGDRKPYPHVWLAALGRRRRAYSVHRLVCWAFHGPPPFPGAHACHLDDDADNCAAGNLAWGTSEANVAMRGRTLAPHEAARFLREGEGEDVRDSRTANEDEGEDAPF